MLGVVMGGGAGRGASAGRRLRTAPHPPPTPHPPTHHRSPTSPQPILLPKLQISFADFPRSPSSTTRGVNLRDLLRSSVRAVRARCVGGGVSRVVARAPEGARAAPLCTRARLRLRPKPIRQRRLFRALQDDETTRPGPRPDVAPALRPSRMSPSASAATE